jgi:hypothetical protein
MYGNERDQQAAQLLLFMQGFVLADLDAWLQQPDLPAEAREHYGRQRQALVEAVIAGNTAAAAAGVAHLRLVLDVDVREEARLRTLRNAWQAGKVNKQKQAASFEAAVADVFAAVWRDGMKRERLHRAALAELEARHEKCLEQLDNMKLARNRPGVRKARADIKRIERQLELTTEHRARVWLEHRAAPP